MGARDVSVDLVKLFQISALWDLGCYGFCIIVSGLVWRSWDGIEVSIANCGLSRNCTANYY